VAWCWSAPASRNLVVVNLSEGAAEARVALPWDDLAGRAWTLRDRLSDQSFSREGDELASEGLYAGLDGWGTHFLAFE
jgi:hypothetical protein